MSNYRNVNWTRRQFLSTAALAGTGALLGRSNLRQSPPSHRLRRLESSWCRPLVCARHLSLWPRSFCMPRGLLK